MKSKHLIIIAVVIVAVIGIRYALQLLQAPSEAPEVDIANTDNRGGELLGENPGWQEAPPTEEEKKKAEAEKEKERADAIIEEYGFDPQKIANLRETAINGDPRTPPIKRLKERQLPTAEELADPELYALYEEHQTRKFFAGFVRAAEAKIQTLEKIIAEGKQYNMPEKDIKAGEEKIAALKAEREKILTQYPDILDTATPDLDLLKVTEVADSFGDKLSDEAKPPQ